MGQVKYHGLCSLQSSLRHNACSVAQPLGISFSETARTERTIFNLQRAETRVPFVNHFTRMSDTEQVEAAPRRSSRNKSITATVVPAPVLKKKESKKRKVVADNDDAEEAESSKKVIPSNYYGIKSLIYSFCDFRQRK